MRICVCEDDIGFPDELFRQVKANAALEGAIPNLTAELRAQFEEEEDLAKLNRSFGR